MALSKSETQFISVGVDSKILIWKDCSVENKIEKDEAEEKRIQQDNDLNVFMQRGDYVSAMKIALDTGKVFGLVNIIKKVCDLEHAAATLEKFIYSLESHQV